MFFARSYMRGNSTDSDESWDELNGQPNTSVSKPGLFEVSRIRSHTGSVNSIDDEWISVEHWWNGTEWGKLKYWEVTLSQRLVIHRNSHVVWPGIEPRPTQGEANN